MTHSASSANAKHLGMAKRKRDVCNPYIAPTATDTIKAFDTTVIQWNPTAACLSSFDDIDIYLHSTAASSSIHIWASVPLSSGKLSTSFNPTWWNSTTGPTTYQLLIVGAGEPVWTSASTGPIFNVNFDGTTPATATSADAAQATNTGPSVEVISTDGNSSTSLGAGKIAAAVVVPLLAILAAAAVYIFYSRKKSATESKRWSAYVDQRMSTLSGAKWEQGATAGGSVHSRAGSKVSGVGSVRPNMAQLAAMDLPRPSFQSHGSRISRVSFAEPPRPSLGQRHGSSLSIARNFDSSLALEPGQSDGPTLLNSKTIGGMARSGSGGNLSAQRPASSASALRFELGSSPMKGNGSTMNVEALAEDEDTRDAVEMMFDHLATENPSPKPDIAIPEPAVVAPAPTSARSSSSSGSASPTESSLGSGPASGMRRLSKVRTSTLSPDEALRQYTLARATGASGTSTPPPVPSLGGMRVLYTPEETSSADAASEAQMDADMGLSPPKSLGMMERGPSVYSEGSRYSVASTMRTTNPPEQDGSASWKL